MHTLLSLLVALPVAQARFLHSLPDDTHAFPKFSVAFLNGLPLLNHTAQHWLAHGLRGGEQEFLDKPWSPREIAASDATLYASPTHDYVLQHMKMGPRDSYLCLIPKPLHNIPVIHDDDSDPDVTPARSWSLLQPLSGTCLYHRQGWFTYSYCHNDEIRQFKEMVPSQPRLPGTYRPEEDPEWESYTLGRAPRNAELGADLTLAEQNAQAADLELARTAGSRYLVQRWTDGTICDKTGTTREVEVQFHCSMEMTDHILFVKETKTCSYVLVVHTPRLCGEPGFKSRRDAGEEAEIRCREIVDSLPPDSVLQLPTGAEPFKVPMRKTVLPAAAKGGDPHASNDQIFNDLLRRSLEALVKAQNGGNGKDVDSDGDLVIEVDDENYGVESSRLVDALRAAGYDVHAEVIKIDEGKLNDDKKRKQSAKHTAARDEL